MKIEGDDFFCGLTFPVKDTHCSLIVGGWGGGVVGLSSIDGMDASENDTTKYLKFEKNKWYKIKVEVRPDRIKAWVDEDKMVDAETTDHKIDLRAGRHRTAKAARALHVSNDRGVAEHQVHHAAAGQKTLNAARPFATPRRMEAVQTPIIPVVADLIRRHPGTISLGQGVVYYGPPPQAEQKVAEFFRAPEIHKYKPVHGIPELVEAFTKNCAPKTISKSAPNAHCS